MFAPNTDVLAATLPSGGDALALFKLNNAAPLEHRWGRAGVALEDPDERLAEFDDFPNGNAETDEEEAMKQIRQISHELRAARTPDAQLRPYFDECDRIIGGGGGSSSSAASALDELLLPVCLSSFLLLGDASSAADVEHLTSLGVTHVLNASNVPCPSELADLYKAAGIEYCQADAAAEDSLQYDMRSEALPRALTFATSARAQQQQQQDEPEAPDKAKAKGSKCLVHCQAGINRSGFIAACLLMLLDETPVLDVVRRLKAARGTVLLNPSFRLQLLEVAREHELLGRIAIGGV